MLTSRGLRAGLPGADPTRFRATLVSFAWRGEEMLFRTRDIGIEGEAVGVAVFTGDPDEALEPALARANALLRNAAADPFDNVILNAAASTLQPGFPQAPRLRAFVDWAHEQFLDAADLR